MQLKTCKLREVERFGFKECMTHIRLISTSFSTWMEKSLMIMAASSFVFDSHNDITLTVSFLL